MGNFHELGSQASDPPASGCRNLHLGSVSVLLTLQPFVLGTSKISIHIFMQSYSCDTLLGCAVQRLRDVERFPNMH